MIRLLLKRLSAEYEDDMICKRDDVYVVVCEEARKEHVRLMGCEPRTDVGEASLAGRAALVYRMLQSLALLEEAKGPGEVRVCASRAKALLALVESWKPEAWLVEDAPC